MMAEGRPRGGRIARVGPLASAAGLKSGDVVSHVNGVALHDVIDWWWTTADGSFVATLERDGRTLEVSVPHDGNQPLDVTFTEMLFDGVRQCENACAFCFVAQLPGGLRPALYVRDDDFRLSFLTGNFVTLTNMTADDIRRVIAQRLSPLHVSVHAVDPQVRQRLICSTMEDRALERLDELLQAGIEVHAQIVLIRGMNDGDVLDDTLTYLSAREGVRSVGVVPMGYTRHQARWTASWDSETAKSVIAQLEGWQARCRPRRDVGWVYPADEFYLLSGSRIPAADAYDGFPQYENGIGMVSAFLDEFRPPRRRLVRRSAPSPMTLVTGELFAPGLRSLVLAAPLRDVSVLAVPNTLFGGNVSVTGLLGGGDIVSAIIADGARGTYLVPDVVVNSDGLLLDDVPAARLAELAGTDVQIVGRDAKSLANALLGRQGRGFL